MNPQSRNKDNQDQRDERWARARRTGHYQDDFTGGGVPMELIDGRLVPKPGYIEAAKRRRNIMMSRKVEEHETCEV